MIQEIKINKTQTPKSKGDLKDLGFGKIFTDHMFLMDYDKDKGWHDARIVSFAPLEISPASVVLHYAPEIFEGMKAYRTPKGKIQLFRPMENIKRMNNSAERMCLPKIDEDMFMDALKKLVELEKDWVPSEPFTSLYIRPFMFANDAHLGVHTPEKVVFVIILSPVGSYFKEGINPVRMLIEKDDVRAVKGGTGFAKCGGNYAGSLRAAEIALQKGYAQVLWLDAVEKKYIEEGGGMNVMFKIGGKIITPMLTGSILPGITRKSILELAKSEGIPCEERLISVQEIEEAVRKGTLEECWCCGTAAVIGPIGELAFGDEKFTINDFKTGPMARRLYDELTDIQWGKSEDKFGWTVPVC
ncbi:MAG: branched-chain amino acid aminotransferase [Synergistaceae bacterium]|nr:branched-chain amino acid aminotransferase [Synergistaceae bacterium]